MRKLAAFMHMQQATLRENYIDSVSLLAARDPERYAEELGLDADQLAILIRNRDRAREVIRKLAEGRKKREKELKAGKPEKTAKESASPDPEQTERAGTRRVPSFELVPEPEELAGQQAPVKPEAKAEPEKKPSAAGTAPSPAPEKGPEPEPAQPKEKPKTQATLFDGF
jgi:hypothetical protein